MESRSDKLCIGCVGDVMLAGRPADVMRQMGIRAMAEKIWSPLRGADLILANLEIPITEGENIREDKRYNFRATPEVLGLFDDRFVISLANNHMLDYGERGLLDTIEALKRRNIPYAGAGRNLDEARRPVITEVAGIKIGILSAADPRFQAATRTTCGTFPAHPALMKESIQELRRTADITLVSIHAGTEFLPVPSPFQLRIAELCLAEGVRVVNFHHAHCVSGFMREERGVVFFGTGNYVFPYNLPKGFISWKQSAAWHVTLTPSGQVEKVDIRPVFLDDDGLPGPPSETQSQRILRKISRYSDYITRENYLRWWRFLELLRPFYLRINLIHYADIVRRKGLLSMLKTVAGGVKAQLR